MRPGSWLKRLIVCRLVLEGPPPPPACPFPQPLPPGGGAEPMPVVPPPELLWAGGHWGGGGGGGAGGVSGQGERSLSQKISMAPYRTTAAPPQSAASVAPVMRAHATPAA